MLEQNFPLQYEILKKKEILKSVQAEPLKILTIIINEDIEFIEIADLNYDNKIDIFDLLHIIESF